MIGTTIHLLLHGLVPGVVARVLFQSRWKWAWFVLCVTMLVDLDHLLADPIFDSSRCGIGFHPLQRTRNLDLCDLVLGTGSAPRIDWALDPHGSRRNRLPFAEEVISALIMWARKALPCFYGRTPI